MARPKAVSTPQDSMPLIDQYITEAITTLRRYKLEVNMSNVNLMMVWLVALKGLSNGSTPSAESFAASFMNGAAPQGQGGQNKITLLD